MRSILILLLSIFISRASAQINTKFIAANYYKGVVKILLFDSTAEKQKAGTGYLGRGSGFFVTDDGVIFTNNHVIEYCVTGYADYVYKDASGKLLRKIEKYTKGLSDSKSITKFNHTGFPTPIIQVYYGKLPNEYKLYVAKVLTYGAGSFDGAVLKIVSTIDGKPVNEKFTPLPIGNSDNAQQGADFCVFGYPAQVDGNMDIALKDMTTLTFGKFSGMDYTFNEDYGFMKTDASINGGNSGGPVFDETNKVIGIATAKGIKTGIGLVGGINGMYYILGPENSILEKLKLKGLTTPKVAGSIYTKTGKKDQIPTAYQLNAKLGGDYTSNNNSGNTYNNASSNSYYSKSKISFVTTINADGTLGTKYSSFTINPGGSFVYIDVDNTPSKLNTTGFLVDVYKMSSTGNYDFHETKTYNIKPELTASYFKYYFYSAGNYKFSIYTKEEQLINTGYVKINMSGSTGNSNTNTAYSNSKVYFSEYKPDDMGVSPPASAVYSNKETWVIVDNYPNTISSSGIIVDIWKKDINNKYVFHETKKYTISPSNKTTYFRYTFYNPGDYKFSVYNAESKLINTGYISAK